LRRSIVAGLLIGCLAAAACRGSQGRTAGPPTSETTKSAIPPTAGTSAEPTSGTSPSTTAEPSVTTVAVTTTRPSLATTAVTATRPSDPPHVKLTCPGPIDAAAPVTVQFGLSGSGGAEPRRGDVDYGDGSGESGSIPRDVERLRTHLYRTPGTYVVRVDVTDAVGRSAFDSCIVVVRQHLSGAVTLGEVSTCSTVIADSCRVSIDVRNDTNATIADVVVQLRYATYGSQAKTPLGSSAEPGETLTATGDVIYPLPKGQSLGVEGCVRSFSWDAGDQSTTATDGACVRFTLFG
jgi:PKD domain